MLEELKPDADVLTPEEVTDSLAGLTPVAWRRLRSVAAIYSSSCPYEPEDLLMEAFTRAIAGVRKCPRDIDPVRFISEVMHSISSDSAKAAGRERTHLQLVPMAGGGEDLADLKRSAEEELISRQQAERMMAALRELFEDDIVALTMVDGFMEAMEGEELRQLTGLDHKAFASKRTKIRRRIETAYPKGWKS